MFAWMPLTDIQTDAEIAEMQLHQLAAGRKDLDKSNNYVKRSSSRAAIEC